MIRFGISAKAVKDAEETEALAKDDAEKAREAFASFDFKRGDTESSKVINDLDAKNSKWSKANLIAEAMRAARTGQVENAIRRALFDHAEDLDGKPAHYKRTAKQVKEIVAKALDISLDDVSAYDDDRSCGFVVYVAIDGNYYARATVNVYVRSMSGMLEKENIRSSCMPYDDGRDDLTPAKVRRMVDQREKEKKALEKSADALRERAHKASLRYACIGDTETFYKASCTYI